MPENGFSVTPNFPYNDIAYTGKYTSGKTHIRANFTQ